MHKEYPVGTMLILNKADPPGALAAMCFVVEEINNYRQIVFFQTNGNRWSAEISLHLPQAWMRDYEVVYP